MTVYLDTSNLVKLYLDEVDSDAVQSLVGKATAIATSVLAYIEARATFARRRRERILSRAQHEAAVQQFDTDWSRFLVIGFGDELRLAAGRLADLHELRGGDAVHLASFEKLVSRSDDDDVEFSCADDRLVRAARTLGRRNC